MPTLPDKTALAEKRGEIARHLADLEATLEVCSPLTREECAAFLACKFADVPARLEKMRADASFFRQVLFPVIWTPSEITPEASK